MGTLGGVVPALIGSAGTLHLKCCNHPREELDRHEVGSTAVQVSANYGSPHSISRVTTISNLAYQFSNADDRPETDQADPFCGSICPPFVFNSGDSLHEGTVLGSHRSTDRRRNFEERELGDQSASVHVISRHQLRHCRHWQSAFASQHKDHRYYEIVEDTIHPEFEYLYGRRDSGNPTIFHSRFGHPWRSSSVFWAMD
jgi:hypothetical protein